MTITRKQAFTTDLVEEIIDLAAGRMGFKAIQKKLAGKQRRTFYNLKRNFTAIRANKEMQRNIYGAADLSNKDVEFDSKTSSS
jgi:hypothetical protein